MNFIKNQFVRIQYLRFIKEKRGKREWKIKVINSHIHQVLTKKIDEPREKTEI